MEIRIVINKKNKIVGYTYEENNSPNTVLLDLSVEDTMLLYDRSEKWVYKGDKIVGINHTINLG